MSTTTHAITDKRSWLTMRTADVTSTEISALFGCCPYLTSFDLWHRKKNADVVELDPNVRMTWGTRLERSIATGVAEDQGWEVKPKATYVRDPVERIGSSFDFEIVESGVCICGKPKHDGPVDGCAGFVSVGPGILEVKNVDGLVFRDGWLVTDDGVEAPPHIELQLQHQLLITGYSWGVIAALIGGNRVELIHRKADAAIHAAILAKTRAFWRSIDANEPPQPDFTRDAAVIARLYGFAEPESVMDATDNEVIAGLCLTVDQAREVAKEAEERMDAAKAELRTLIGTAEKILTNGFTISAGMVGPTRVEAYDRKGYRNLRITRKRAKN